MRSTRGQARISKRQASQAAAAAVAPVPVKKSAALMPGTMMKKEPKQEVKIVIKKEEPKLEVATAAKKEQPKPQHKQTDVEPKLEPKTGAVVASALSLSSESKEMAEYERKRLENIQRNLEFMKSMGVSTAKIAARVSVAKPKGLQAKRKPVEPQLPTRKSRRIQGKQSDNLALGDVYNSSTDYVILYGKGGDHSADEAEDRRGRLDPKLAAQAINLSGDKGRIFLDSIAGGLDSNDEREERETDLKVDATGIETVDYHLSSDDFVKATEERVYSMAFHPRTDKLVVAAGDKRGNLSLWSADEETDEENVVVMYRPHTSPVTQLHFSPHDSTKLLSSSFDGSIREFDLKAGSFTEHFGTSDNVGITSMTIDRDNGAFLISCEDGHIWSIDQRQPSSKQSQYLLHEKKINTLHQHPLFSFCLATASLDRTVCLWDIRKLKKTKNQPLVTMPHSRSVNCAYFSPLGDHLVTVGQDNYVNVFDTRDAKHEDAHSVAPTLAIPHNNQTGRWLTKLHASWDPKRKDRFVIGCMQQPRRIQIFEATRKNPIQELTSENFNSVHSINVYHPTLDAIAGGNSSGRLSLWRGTCQKK